MTRGCCRLLLANTGDIPMLAHPGVHGEFKLTIELLLLRLGVGALNGRGLLNLTYIMLSISIYKQKAARVLPCWKGL